jgi:hypothetical protein
MQTVMGCDAKLIQRGSLNIFKANIGEPQKRTTQTGLIDSTITTWRIFSKLN